jgi:hypothetical protein
MYSVALMNLAEPPTNDLWARISLNAIAKMSEKIGLYSKEDFLCLVAKEQRFANSLEAAMQSRRG